MKSENCCENCRYWKRESVGEQIAKGQSPRPQGTCRADPPRIFALPYQSTVVFQTLFPLTEAAEWCGRHVVIVAPFIPD